MNLLNIFLFVFFITLTACGSNSPKDEHGGDVADQTEVTKEDTPGDYYETEDNDREDYERDDYVRESGNSDLSKRPPKIKQIKVEAVSNSLKDGFRAVVTTHDNENKNINFIYQWKHNGIDIIGATEQILEWNEEFKKGDTITLEIIPYDDLSEGIWKSEGNFTIPNSPPVISSLPSGSINGTSFSYKVEASDLDGDTLKYTIQNAPEGMAINPETGEIIWEYGVEDTGEYKIGIEVNDGDGGQSFQELSITVN